MRLIIEETLKLCQRPSSEGASFTKRQKFANIRKIKDILGFNKMIICLNHSKNFKCLQQNNIEKTCFSLP